MKKIIFLLVAILASSYGVYAQHNFPAVTGPVLVTQGSPETLVINDAANTAGAPAGLYSEFTVTADWVEAGGGPYSSEADLTMTTTAGSVLIDPPTTGGASNGNATTLTFSGSFTASYDPTVDGTMSITLNQSWSGSSANWSNIVVTIIEAPTCLEPSGLSASAITTTTADLGWTENGTATTWDIEWGASGFTPSGTPTIAGVTTNPYPLTGLTASTSYDFYVRADCGGGDLSAWAGPFNFTTLCVAFTSLSENFDSYGTGNIVPNCWNRLIIGTGSQTISSTSPASGTRNIYQYSSAPANQTFVILPEFSNISAGTHRLKFKTRVGSGTGHLEVGYMTDATSAATFVNIQTVNATNIAYGLETIIPIPNSVPSGARLAIRNPGISTVSHYWDDVVYEATPSCVAPTALTATNITNNSATFNWTASATETGGYEWVVMASGATADPGTAVATGTVGTGVVTTSATGLSQNTAYSFYVRANCGANGLSAWAGPFTFTTPLLVAPPFTEGFATTTTPAGWNTTGWIIGSTRGVTGNPGNNIYKNIYTTGTSGSSFRSSAIGPVTANMILSFDYMVALFSSPYGPPAAGSGDFVVEISTDYGTTYSVLETVANDGVAGWQSKNYPLTAYAGQDVVFKITGNWVSQDWDMAFDNFYIGLTITCPQPSGLTASNITQTTVDLSWTENGTATTWDIEWGAVGFTPTGNPTIAGVTTNPYPLSGLLDGTEYDFYVRADCGGGDLSTWSDPYTFSTLCLPYTIPYFEGFETGYTHNTIVEGCLSQESITGVQVWTANNTETTYNRAPRTGNWNATLRYGNEDWLFIPIELTAGTSYTFDAYARQDGATATNASLTVSYGTSASSIDMVNVIVPETGLVNGPYQLFSDMFTPASTGVYYIGIKGKINSTPWYISLDDISVYETPTCIPPSNLVATSITSTSADLGWTENGTATTWDIEWGAAGFSPTGTPTVSGLTTASYPISGLNSNTSYHFYVRSDCGGGDFSPWVGPFSFTTACGATTVPTSMEDFGNATFNYNTNVNMPCWSEGTGSLTASTTVTVADGGWGAQNYNDNGTHPNGTAAYINLYTSSGSSTAWLISHSIDLDSAIEPELRFDVSVIPWSGTSPVTTMGSHYVQVVVSTDDGATWSDLNIVQTYDDLNIPDGGISEEINLSSYSGVVKIGFYAYREGSTPDLRFYIDNFEVVETFVCDAPTALTLVSVTETTADFSWTASATETDGYNWIVMEDGDDPLTDTPVTSGSTATGITTAMASGLDDDTDYDFYVQTNCGSGNLSAWAGPLSFTTDEIVLVCAPPTNLTLVNVTVTTADISWTASPDETDGYSWVVMEDGDDPLTDTPVDSGTTATGVTTASASGLDDDTDYDFYVQTNCGSGNLSVWAGPLNFTTDEIVLVCAPPTNLMLVNVTDTTADFSWTASPDETNGYSWVVMEDGDDPLTDTPVDSGTTATGVTTASASGLVDDTDYDFYVMTDCGANGDSTWAGPLAFTTDVGVPVFPAPYCAANFTNCTWESITNVTFAGINNTTGCDTGISDYTAQVATVNQGSTYPISVTISADSQDYIYVFFDWNQNDELDDAGEVYTVVSNTSSNGPHTININVPAGATLGTTRMRVVLEWDSSGPDPCVSRTFGEVEDYSVEVLPAAPVCPMPLALNVDVVTDTTIDFSWTPPTDISDVEGYFWRLMNSGDDPFVDPSVDEDFVPGATSTSAMITGLTPGTDYDLYLVSVCDQTTLFISDSIMVAVTTDIVFVCDMPTAVTLGTVEATTAEFSWTASATETNGYEWAVFNSGDDPLVDPSVASGTVATGVTSVIVTGLTPVTDYDFYVRTDCDPDGMSDWEGPFAFTTDVLSVNDFDFSSIAFYPNPMGDVLNISGQIEIEKVVIFSLTGQKLIEQRVGSLETQIDVSNFASGPYLIQVTTSTGKTGIFRLIKK